MRRLLLAALLLFAASPVLATVYYARQDSLTGAGNAIGTDSTKAMALLHANAIVTSGDVVKLLGTGADGTLKPFTTTPVPVQSGIGAPILYMSAYNDPKSVTIANAMTVLAADSNVTWRALTFYRPGNSAQIKFGLGSGTAKTRRLSIKNCVVLGGGLTLYNADDCRVDSSSFTNSGVGDICSFSGPDVRNDSTNTGTRDTLNWTSFTLNGAVGPNVGGFYLSGSYHLLNRVRFNMTTTGATSGGCRFMRSETARRVRVTDCLFVGNNQMSGGGTDEPMTFSFKNINFWNKWYRDTVVVKGNAGTGGSWITLAQDESGGPIGSNTFYGCYLANLTGLVNGNVSLSNYSVYGSDGDSLVYNTFVNKAEPIDFGFNRGATLNSDSTIITHNCFISYGHNEAFTSHGIANNQPVRFTSNIFYAPNLAPGDLAAHGVVNFGRTGDWTANTYGPLGNDYNLASAPSSGSSSLVKWSGGQSTFTGAWSTANGTAQDAHSITGTALFTNTVDSLFDAHPLAGSAALFGPGGFVGPYALTGGTLHTITATTGAGGTISPSGSVQVADGATQQFNITPGQGYGITSVAVDNVTQDVSQYPNSQYVFTNVTADHTISVTFALQLIRITPSAGANGTIVPSSGVDVTYGGSQTFTITPNASYSVLDVLVDGASVGSVASYTFTNVTSAHTISASFALTANNWTITPSYSGSGTLSPSSVQSVADGATPAFTFSANSGYYVASVLVDGVAVSTSSPYTFSAVHANHTIAVTFGALATYIASGSNGSVGGTVTYGAIYPSDIVGAVGGQSLTFQIVPQPFYRVAAVYVDGTNVGPVNSYTFTNITINHTISASFTTTPTFGPANWRRRR